MDGDHSEWKAVLRVLLQEMLFLRDGWGSLRFEGIMGDDGCRFRVTVVDVRCPCFASFDSRYRLDDGSTRTRRRPKISHEGAKRSGRLSSSCKSDDQNQTVGPKIIASERNFNVSRVFLRRHDVMMR
jgi:hypothetical protein